MKKQNESKSKTQVFVPKGTVSSTEDTVIEIPSNLLGKSMIIAKKQDSQRNVRVEDRDRRSDLSRNTTYRPAVQHPSVDLNLERSLNETENMEREALLSQLEQYHQTRRKYLMEAASLATSRPNLPMPMSTAAPFVNTASACPSTSFGFNLHGMPQTPQYGAAPGISLVVPPLPQISTTEQEEPCCDRGAPLSSSSFQVPSRRRRREGKSSGTSTSDLQELPASVRFVPNRTEVITGHYPGNYETHEPFRDNYNEKENIIPAQSVNFAPFEKESTQSVIGNEPRLSQSAPASIEKSDPSDLILERTSSEARECMSKTLLSINELDKIRTLFEETKKNLREVYSLASTLTCDTCSSRTKNNSKNVEYKQQNTVRRSVENRQRDIENRLKESQELLRKETEQLKNILQDTKITCTNPMLLFCNDSKDIPETKVTEPTSTRIPAHVQRSILKQPSRSENLRESHKCQAESNKTQLQPEYNLDRDTSSKITVSTDVFLGDDPNPKCSNVTSTYYNKDFLVRSQSENFPDTNTRDIGICTDYNCPVFRKK